MTIDGFQLSPGLTANHGIRISASLNSGETISISSDRIIAYPDNGVNTAGVGANATLLIQACLLALRPGLVTERTSVTLPASSSTVPMPTPRAHRPEVEAGVIDVARAVLLGRDGRPLL